VIGKRFKGKNVKKRVNQSERTRRREEGLDRGRGNQSPHIRPNRERDTKLRESLKPIYNTIILGSSQQHW